MNFRERLTKNAENFDQIISEMLQQSDKVKNDSELLDEADRVGHADAKFSSIREEADLGKGTELADS